MTFDEGRNARVFDKRATSKNLYLASIAVSGELDILRGHPPPQPLADKYRRVTSALADWKNEYQQQIALLHSPSVPNTATDAELSAAIASTSETDIHVRAQLGDALSGLAGKPCTV